MYCLWIKDPYCETLEIFQPNNPIPKTEEALREFLKTMGLDTNVKAKLYLCQSRIVGNCILYNTDMFDPSFKTISINC